MREHLYLLAYDIADPRRLGRVARFMNQRACRVQYSVFATRLSKSGLSEILEELKEIIDLRQDDIRAYPLPETGEVSLLGQQFFATNTLLVQNGHCRLELLQDTGDDGGCSVPDKGD